MSKTIKAIKTEIDGATDTAVEIELTAEEIAEVKLREAQAVATQEQLEADEAAKVAAKLSAETKLAALGLTADEIAALKG
jgi:hypothetical protein